MHAQKKEGSVIPLSVIDCFLVLIARTIIDGEGEAEAKQKEGYFVCWKECPTQSQRYEKESKMEKQ